MDHVEISTIKRGNQWALFLFLATLIGSNLLCLLWPNVAAGAEKNSAVKLDLYVMSQCPFGVKAENAIFPAVRALGKSVDFNLYFIADHTIVPPGQDGKPAAPAFKSLHGQPEVDENIRHLCAMKLYPKQYMDFILTRNVSNAKSANWQDDAKKSGMDPAKIEACYSGPDGAALLTESINASKARNATGSPTIYINDVQHRGGRGVRAITLAVCDAMTAKGMTLPDACQKAKDMPPDPADSAGGCGDGGQKAAVAQPIAAPPIQTNRKLAPRHLDVFVEPLSPQTEQVETQLVKILSESDAKNLTFSMHFIVQETVKADESASSKDKSPSTGVRAVSLKDEIKNVSAGPLTSRKGQEELKESLRQVCLFQHASIGTFFAYLACRNQNLNDPSRADTCLQTTEPLKKCMEGGEGENLLRQDARLARELGISNGPVFLWENRVGPFNLQQVNLQQMIKEGK